MTNDNKSMKADLFVRSSVLRPYENLKSDKYLSSGQNIAMWLTLFFLTFPLLMLVNYLLIFLVGNITSDPYLGMGLLISIFSMIFYTFYIPFFLLNSYIIYKFSDKTKPFEKIFSDNSAMLIFPFLLYSIGAMMSAYVDSVLHLLGLFVMWGAIIIYIVRSTSQLKQYQESSGTQTNTKLYVMILIILMLAPSIIMLLLSPETVAIYYKPLIDTFFLGI